MSYLLDTHTLIWYFEDSPNLSKEVIDLIDDALNNKCICSVSLWEIAIKKNIGKLKLKLSLEELLTETRNSDLKILQIEDTHLKRLSELPFLHKDPFDRLIIAAAIAEKMTIITIDENIQKYDVPWIW